MYDKSEMVVFKNIMQQDNTLQLAYVAIRMQLLVFSLCS
jgi:hypothetical protein